MNKKLSGIRVAVIGGDDRELILIPELVKLGAFVKVVGYPPRPELKGVNLVDSVKEALENVDVVIFPMPGTDDSGRVKATYAEKPLIISNEIFRSLKPKTLLLVGAAKKILKDMANKHDLKLIETADLDEIAILNSIPTAEGAVQLAMEELPITIHGCKALVLGLGRCGTTLAGLLKALGAKVFVAVRKQADLAKGYVQGYQVISYSELDQFLPVFDVIFNTVPHLILNRNKLALLSKDCLIIDIATAPGGTDFSAAQDLGIKALLAPGLPGKVAPKTAGKILADTYPGLILREISKDLGVCK